jgi:hypothetical protein
MQLYQASAQYLIRLHEPNVDPKEKQKPSGSTFGLLQNLIYMITLMCRNPSLKMNIGLMIRQSAYNPLPLLIHVASWNRPNIMMCLLDLIDTLADDFDTAICWSNFRLQLQQYPIISQVASSNQKIQHKLETICYKIDSYLGGYSQQPNFMY